MQRTIPVADPDMFYHTEHADIEARRSMARPMLPTDYYRSNVSELALLPACTSMIHCSFSQRSRGLPSYSVPCFSDPQMIFKYLWVSKNVFIRSTSDIPMSDFHRAFSPAVVRDPGRGHIGCPIHSSPTEHVFGCSLYMLTRMLSLSRTCPAYTYHIMVRDCEVGVSKVKLTAERWLLNISTHTWKYIYE